MEYMVFRNNAAYYSPGERFTVLPLSFVVSPLSTLLSLEPLLLLASLR